MKWEQINNLRNIDRVSKDVCHAQQFFPTMLFAALWWHGFDDPLEDRETKSNQENASFSVSCVVECATMHSSTSRRLVAAKCESEFLKHARTWSIPPVGTQKHAQMVKYTQLRRTLHCFTFGNFGKVTLTLLRIAGRHSCHFPTYILLLLVAECVTLSHHSVLASYRKGNFHFETPEVLQEPAPNTSNQYSIDGWWMELLIVAAAWWAPRPQEAERRPGGADRPSQRGQMLCLMKWCMWMW